MTVERFPTPAFWLVVSRDMQGDYWMEVTFEGHVIKKARVDIQPGQTATMPIQLQAV